VAAEIVSNPIAADSFRLALSFAGLTWSKLHTGSHPDSGAGCLWLEADIREYSAFLTALAVQFRSADELAFLTDRVQIEHDSNGDTRFWMPGLEIQD